MVEELTRIFSADPIIIELEHFIAYVWRGATGFAPYIELKEGESKQFDVSDLEELLLKLGDVKTNRFG